MNLYYKSQYIVAKHTPNKLIDIENADFPVSELESPEVDDTPLELLR
jgi:hypothetical protein